MDANGEVAVKPRTAAERGRRVAGRRGGGPAAETAPLAAPVALAAARSDRNTACAMSNACCVRASAAAAGMAAWLRTAPADPPLQVYYCCVFLIESLRCKSTSAGRVCPVLGHGERACCTFGRDKEPSGRKWGDR